MIARECDKTCVKASLCRWYPSYPRKVPNNKRRLTSYMVFQESRLIISDFDVSRAILIACYLRFPALWVIPWVYRSIMSHRVKRKARSQTLRVWATLMNSHYITLILAVSAVLLLLLLSLSLDVRRYWIVLKGREIIVLYMIPDLGNLQC